MQPKISHLFDLHLITAADIARGRTYKVWQPGLAVPYVGDGTPVCQRPARWEVEHAEVSLVHVTSGSPYLGHYLEIEAPGPGGEGKMILAGDWQAWGKPAMLNRTHNLMCGIGWAIFCKSLTAGDGVYFRARYKEYIE